MNKFTNQKPRNQKFTRKQQQLGNQSRANRQYMIPSKEFEKSNPNLVEILRLGVDEYTYQKKAKRVSLGAKDRGVGEMRGEK